jgi:hypothetical protein
MSDLAAIIIPDRPMTSDEVLVHEELFSEAQTLGDAQQLRRIREGGISFGRPIVYPLSLEDFPELVRRRPDAKHRAFVLIEFPFDLDEILTGRRYIKARYKIALNTPDAVVRSLWPVLVTTSVEVEQSKTFTIHADLSLGALIRTPSVELKHQRVYTYTENNDHTARNLPRRSRDRASSPWSFGNQRHHDQTATLPTPAP